MGLPTALPNSLFTSCSAEGLGVTFIWNRRNFSFFTSASNFSKIGVCAFNSHTLHNSIHQPSTSNQGKRAVTAQQSSCLRDRTKSSAVPVVWLVGTTNNNDPSWWIMSHQGSSNDDRDTLSQKTGKYVMHIGKQPSKEVQIKKSLGIWQHQVPGVRRSYSRGSS